MNTSGPTCSETAWSDRGATHEPSIGTRLQNPVIRCPRLTEMSNLANIKNGIQPSGDKCAVKDSCRTPSVHGRPPNEARVRVRRPAREQ